MVFGNRKTVCWGLAVAVWASSSGCASARTVKDPTLATFGGRLREGNQVALVLRDGRSCAGTVTSIRTDGLMVDGGEMIGYASMREGRKVVRVDAGESVYRAKEAVAPVVAVTAVVGLFVVCPFWPLIALAGGGGGGGCGR